MERPADDRDDLGAPDDDTPVEYDPASEPQRSTRPVSDVSPVEVDPASEPHRDDDGDADSTPVEYDPASEPPAR